MLKHASQGARRVPLAQTTNELDTRFLYIWRTKVMQPKQKIMLQAFLHTLLLWMVVTSEAYSLARKDTPDRSNSQSINQAGDQQMTLSTTHAPNYNGTLSPDENFQLYRDFAIMHRLRKVLRALGPKFEEGLPTVPTNATLTPLNSTLRVETGLCPEYYKRCSSQTFYPSCEVPRNTDELMWNQRFTLYFNISSEISSIQREDLLNATLRLYKNLSLPLTNPRMLIVKLHAFKSRLMRNRERSVPIASTRVASDYVGWVFMDVAKLIRRLKGKRPNYGVKISVQDENNVPWNIPDLFVKMDCQASNDSLIPLPFEVQLDDSTQRYPALNIRSGTQEVFIDNNAYPILYPHSESNLQQPIFARGPHQYYTRPHQRRYRKNRIDSHYRNHHHNNNYNGDNNYDSNRVHYSRENNNLDQQHLDQLVNPHLYVDDISESNHLNVNVADDETPNYYGEDNPLDTDFNEQYQDQPSPTIWSPSGSYPDESFHQHISSTRPQPRHKKQSPQYADHDGRTGSQIQSPDLQHREHRPFTADNQNAEVGPSQYNVYTGDRPYSRAEIAGSGGLRNDRGMNGDHGRHATHERRFKQDKYHNNTTHRVHSEVDADRAQLGLTRNNNFENSDYNYQSNNDYNANDYYYSDYTENQDYSRHIQMSGEHNSRSRPGRHSHRRHPHRQRNHHDSVSRRLRQHRHSTTEEPVYRDDAREFDTPVQVAPTQAHLKPATQGVVP